LGFQRVKELQFIILYQIAANINKELSFRDFSSQKRAGATCPLFACCQQNPFVFTRRVHGVPLFVIAPQR
jgi:hypothetical protein